MRKLNCPLEATTRYEDEELQLVTSSGEQLLYNFKSFVKTPPDDGLKTLNMYRDFIKTQNLI